MACNCDSGAICAASVELFHAVMASRLNGAEVPVGGVDHFWTKYPMTGERYRVSGNTCVYSYNNGSILAAITYNMELIATQES